MATRPSIFPLNKSGSWFWLQATGVLAILFGLMTAVARSAHGEQFWPHAFCYLWNPWLLRYNLWSDALIAGAYLSISLTLVYLVRQAKREIPFHWMFISFGTFILACGGTHAMEVLTLYKPYYWIAVEVKVLTAVASVMTAIALPPLVPKIKAMLTEAAVSSSRAAALIESEAKFRSIYEGVRVGISVEDLEGKVLDANPELLQMLGSSLERLRGSSFKEFTDDVSVERELPLKRQLRAGALPSYELDKQMRRSDGTVFPAHVTVTRVIGQFTGDQPYVIAIIEDISERVAQQEREKQYAASAAGEQRTRELSEALPALIWTCAPDGNCDYLNERWAQYTGREVAALLGHGWLRTLHPEDRERVNARWEHAVQEGARYEAEFRIRRKDGEYRWFFTRGVPVKREGEILRWVGACVDVHEQRAMHDILHRTERLAATGQLAATIAHEINNPLEAITNIVFLLQTSRELPERFKLLVDDASRELERVSHIVKHSLAFYRDTSKPLPIKVSELVAETIALYKSRALSKQVDVQLEGDEQSVIVGYPGELRQVFSNIVVNALDAAPARGGKIRVRVRRVGRGVRVTIADNGTGIAESVRNRLFDPFVTSKGEKGTGLGLWVSQGIVAKHMGSISVVSSTRPQSHGTTFSVYLPAQNELLLTTAYPQAAKA